MLSAGSVQAFVPFGVDYAHNPDSTIHRVLVAIRIRHVCAIGESRVAIAPTVGTVSYNGYTFGVETETLGVTIIPVWDAADRTIIGNRYTFKIQSQIIAAAGGSNETTLADIRRLLTTPGGAFTYTSKGLGSIQINVAGGTKDLSWGPKPRELSWKPIAGNLAGEIVWQVEFMTMDCSNAKSQFDLMEFVFKVDFEQGKNRLTRRVYSGHIRVPMTRLSAGVKRLTDSVDYYYNQVVPPVPLGFQRENEHRTIDESKTRLDFSFTDQQLIAPLPPGVLNCTIEQQQSNADRMTFFRWSGTINATYEMALHAPMQLSQFYFTTLVEDRLKAIRDTINRQGGIGGGIIGGAPGGAPLRGGVVPVTFSMSENTYQRSMRYSLTYWYIQPIEKILTAGYWRPIPFAQHRVWAQSMAIATRARGYTQDVIRPGDDAIVDLCGPVPYIGTGLVGGALGALGPHLPSPIKVPCPPGSGSWIWYQNVITVTFDQGTITHQPLPQKRLPKPTPKQFSLGNFYDNPNATDPSDHVSTAGDAAAKDKKNQPIQQQRTAPRYYIHLSGFAIRACYEIPAPVLLGIGSVSGIIVNNGGGSGGSGGGGGIVGGALTTVLPDNRVGREFWQQGQLGNAGVPIYYARWSLRWLVGEQMTKPVLSPSSPQASRKSSNGLIVYVPGQPPVEIGGKK